MHRFLPESRAACPGTTQARCPRHSLQSSLRIGLAAAVALLLLAAPALAVQPGKWAHSTEADFEPGETDGAVVTNLGDIKLARRTALAVELEETAAVIFDALTLPDGKVLIAAGPEMKLIQWDPETDETQTVATLENEQAFTLTMHDGKPVIGISGASPRLATLADGELETLADLSTLEVRYVWDVLVPTDDVFPEDSLVVATGLEGKVVLIEPGAGEEGGAKITELLAAQQNNVLCLAQQDAGHLIAGTDTDGLVYRVSADGEAFVLYDAPEPEIGAVYVAADGQIYAGTADAQQARPGRLEAAVSEEAGRPELAPDQPRDGELDPLPDGEPDPDPMQQDDADDADETTAGTDQTTTPQAESAANADGSDDPSDQPTETTNTPDAAPTPEQYDQLRDVIRERLTAARESGALQAGSRRRGSPRPSSSRMARSQSASASSGSGEGNAVYRIDNQGFVTEVFRESVMVLAIANGGPDDDELLIATGNEGQVYRLTLSTGEVTLLTDLEPQQVTLIMTMPDDALALATANPAQITRFESGFAETGTFTSDVLDAAQVSLWGTAQLTANLPRGTAVTVQTRTGNVDDPELAPWSPWSEPQDFATGDDPFAPNVFEIVSPPARFIQYRVTLESDDGHTPSVGSVGLTYIVPNLAPRIASVTASYPETPAFDTTGEAEPEATPTLMNVEWEASDPNADGLVYALDYRPASAEQWLPVADALTETGYEWQTRLVPDGRYKLRLSASDAPGNPGDMIKTATRVSEPVTVDNTPPDPANLTTRRGDDGLAIAFTAKDRLSPIDTVYVRANGKGAWRVILPEDLIADAAEESYRTTLTDLPDGPFTLSIRVSDTRGNAVYRSVMVK